jgi:uncharacterized membrane protein YhhN
MSQLPPYRSIPERFCVAAVLVFFGVWALQQAWTRLQSLVVPIVIMLVVIVIATVIVRRRPSGGW